MRAAGALWASRAARPRRCRAARACRSRRTRATTAAPGPRKRFPQVVREEPCKCRRAGLAAESGHSRSEQRMHTAAAVEPSAIALGHAARTADRRLDRQPPCVDCRTPSLTWVFILSSSATISSRRSLLRSVAVVSLAVNPLDPDCLLAKSAQGVQHRPWPGLTGSAGPLKSVEIRARWCQPWVSPLMIATGEFGWVLSSPRSTGIAYQVHTIGLYGQVYSSSDSRFPWKPPIASRRFYRPSRFDAARLR